MAYLVHRKTGYSLCEKYRSKTGWKTRWIKLGKIPYSNAKTCLNRYHNEQTYLRLGIGADTGLTIHDLIDEYLKHHKGLAIKASGTIYREESLLRVIGAQFGKTKISKFIPDDFSHWLISKKYKPTTARHYILALHQIFKLAIERGYCHTDPTAKIPKPKLMKGPPKYADPDDILRVIEHIQPIKRAPYIIMYYTGLRPSECLRLKFENISLKNGTIDLYPDQTKTAERGLLPMHENLRPVFKELIKGKKKNDYLFPSENGGHVTNLKGVLLRACRRAKVKITPYQFRHTFATLVLERTGDIRTVQQLLRHRSIEMTTRYATAVDSRLREAVGKL